MAMEIHLFPIGNTSSNGGFSIAMLVYRRVHHLKMNGWKHFEICFFSFKLNLTAKKFPILSFLKTAGAQRLFQYVAQWVKNFFRPIQEDLSEVERILAGGFVFFI